MCLWTLKFWNMNQWFGRKQYLVRPHSGYGSLQTYGISYAFINQEAIRIQYNFQNHLKIIQNLSQSRDVTA